VILKIMNLPDFSKLRSSSFEILFSVLLCLCCFGQSAHEQGAAQDPAGQWAAIDSGRIADWAAQLPVGEAKREGIIGAAIV
jgi:hypothetical protein